MSVHYCFGCDRQYDEDFDLECPRCGAPDDDGQPDEAQEWADFDGDC